MDPEGEHMSWMDAYTEKRTSAADAVSGITSGQRVYLGAGCAVPHSLVDALADRKDLRGVHVYHILTMGPARYTDADMVDRFHCTALFVGPNVRGAVNDGRVDYIPIHLHQVPDLFRSDDHRPDVAFVQVSLPDEHGFCSFGIEVGVTRPAARSARRIIAEINRCMPRTLGDSFIHVSKLDACVEVDRPLDTYPRAAMDDQQRRIGAHVATLIDDGACLQLGIGGITEAVLGNLGDKKDLGVHTEMFSDGLLDLMDKGVVTGECKNFHPGKVVAGFVLGSQELYDYVHDNAVIELHPTDYVNNPILIARNERMTAINGALQVDLTGQVCADSIGTDIYSGFGGQVDFMRGAAMSRGGCAITAMRSTACDGTISRIVPKLAHGAGVVTTRADVHYVVTEHGVARMVGRNLRERAAALIEIADPKFREGLLEAARDRKQISPRG